MIGVQRGPRGSLGEEYDDDGRTSLWLDGAQMDQSSISTTLDWAGLGYAAIGSGRTEGLPGGAAGAVHGYTGSIDEAAAYTAALDDTRVLGHYRAALGTLTSAAPYGPTGNGTFTVAAGWHRLRIDYNTGTPSGSVSVSAKNTSTSVVTPLAGALLAPRLGLATTSTVEDSGGAAPASTTRTLYSDTAAGISPVLGLATGTVQDPDGLALTTRTGYEPLGSGYLRRITRTMPTGATTTTTSYGGTETRGNPCPGGGTAVQSGLPKTTTDPDGRTEEAIYDLWGRVVASGIGSGGAMPTTWACTRYDARGRAVASTDPGGRTTTSNWAVDPDGAGPLNPDPLTTSVTDTSGTITTGRTCWAGRCPTPTPWAPPRPPPTTASGW